MTTEHRALRDEARRLIGLTLQQREEEAICAALSRNAESRREGEQLTEMDRQFLADLVGESHE